MASTLEQQIERGEILRFKLSKFCKLAGFSLPTGYRKAKANELPVLRDLSGHLYVEAMAALKYLKSTSYSHDFQNKKAIATMERARKAKSIAKGRLEK